MAVGMTKTKFALSFTAGGLLYSESLVVAEAIMRNDSDWTKAIAEIQQKNLLQCRTQSTATRKLREIKQRLEELVPPQIDLLIKGTRQEQKLVLWLACCLKYPILAAFARDVVRSKYVQLDYQISEVDVERFIDAQSVWHEQLDTLTPSTRRKLQTVILRMLREAELLSKTGLITTPLVSNRFLRELTGNSHEMQLFFPLAIDKG
jgi:hypothetical protein